MQWPSNEVFQPLGQFRRDMERFFNTNFPSFFQNTFNFPRMDVRETPNEVIVTCEIPGLEKKEDLMINLEGRELQISGKVEKTAKKESEQIHQEERYYGSFQRKITLPAEVDENSIRATYKNGILEIRANKLLNNNRKTIDIQFQ
jgi:HSP20 family protein